MPPQCIHVTTPNYLAEKLRTWPLGVKRFLPMTAIDHVAKRTRTARLKIAVSDVGTFERCRPY
jgi:hypothetical protein